MYHYSSEEFQTEKLLLCWQLELLQVFLFSANKIYFQKDWPSVPSLIPLPSFIPFSLLNTVNTGTVLSGLCVCFVFLPLSYSNFVISSHILDCFTDQCVIFWPLAIIIST